MGKVFGMKKILVLLLACCAFGVRAEQWRFAPLPMEKPETIIAAWRPLLDYLESRLGVKILIDYSDSYAEILDKFAAGRIDLAYLGPLPYVELKKRLPAAEPIVHFKEKDGTAFFTCALVALQEANLTPARLVGKKIALTQPLSTCGYLATDALLRAAGSSLEKNRYRYLDKHDAAVLAVARGEYDAAGAKTNIAKRYRHLGIAILAESQPFPGFGLVAHGGRIDATRRERIRQILLDADEQARARWGEALRHGVVAAHDADYEVVRTYSSRRPIPQQGNF